MGTATGSESIDMDNKYEEEKETVDRGDNLEEESQQAEGEDGVSSGDKDGEGGGESAEDEGGKELSIEDLESIANGGNKPAGIPAGRVGELARERSLAVKISDAIIDGGIDPAAVKALGGTVAVAKMINSGDVDIADLSSVDNFKQSRKAEEPLNVGKAWKDYYEAMEDGREEEASEIMGKIDADQTRRVRETAETIVNDRLAEDSKKAAKKTEKQQAKEANGEAARVFSEYPELDEFGEDYDPISFNMFTSAINSYRQNGSSLKEAIILAEKRIYKPAKRESDGDLLSQRDILARKNNADANNRQAPKLESGAGTKSHGETKQLADLTPSQIAKLPKKEKKKLRGDFL